MGWWLRWFGILLGALSLFSLVKQHWDFQLAPFVAQILEFYRTVFHPPAEFIGWLLSYVIWITPPPDLIVVWFLIGGALVRFASDGPQFKNPTHPIAKAGIAALRMLLWPVIFILYCLPLLHLFDSDDVDTPELKEIIRATRRGLGAWVLQIAYAFVAFLLLFALNAGFA